MKQFSDLPDENYNTVELLCSLFNVPHIIIDSSLRIVKYNQSARDYAKIDDANPSEDDLRKWLSPKTCAGIEKVYRKISGGMKYAEEQIISFSEHDQVPMRIVGVKTQSDESENCDFFFIPLMDSKEIAQLIEKEEMKYRLVFENTGAATCIFGDDGVITRCNKKFCELIGFNRDEIEGHKQLSDFIVPEDYERMSYYHKLRSEMKGNPPSEYEFRIYNRRGEELHIHMKISVDSETMERIVSMMDITQRVNALKQLDDQKRFSEQIIHELPLGVFVKDAKDDFRFIVWNRQFEVMTGIPRSATLGKTDDEIVDKPDVAEYYHMKDAETIRNREDVTFYEEHIDSGIRNIWLNVKRVPIFDDNDEPKYILGIVEDITMKKMSEDMMKVKDIAIESSVNGIGIADASGKVTYVNKATVKVFGYDNPMQIVGKNVRDLFPDKAQTGTILDYVLRNGFWDGEISFVNAQGIDKSLAFLCSLAKDKDGKPMSIIAIMNDITERESALSKLKQEKSRLFTILDLLPTPVYIQARDYKIKYGNKAFIERYGEYENRLCHKIVQDRDTPCESCKLFSKYENIDSTSFEWNDPHGRHYLANIIKFTDVDGEELFLKVALDITERSQYEEERLRLQKLDSLGILAGGIAHDFNNLLLIMLGNIEMVMTNFHETSIDYENLDETVKAIRRAQSLTKQLLTFSKGGAPILENTDLDHVIRDSAFFALRGSKTDCEFDHPEDLKNVIADRGQLSQVVQNIVINASAAMPEGGLVRIWAENRTMSRREVEGNLAPDEQCEYVRISISDTGHGIPQENLHRIFDPYFSTKETGHGLGLAVVHSIIRKHNGKIEVQSEVGKYTTFHIYLPASDQKEVYASSTSAFIKGTGRILAVDDQKEVCQMLKRLSKHLGYEIDTAQGEDRALWLFNKAIESKTPYDVVLLDLTIPGENGGIEILRDIRKIDPDIKAIATTGVHGNKSHRRSVERRLQRCNHEAVQYPEAQQDD